MKRFTRCAFALSLVILPLKTNIVAAHDLGANFPAAAVNHLNKHGRDNCNALGKSGYQGKIRGILDDGSGNFSYNGARSFTVRNCFKSKKKCQHFLSRIHHKVSQIERIHYARCKSRA